MSIYKKKIEARIEEIQDLIYQLEVLNEQREYLLNLKWKKTELENIIKACEK